MLNFSHRFIQVTPHQEFVELLSYKYTYSYAFMQKKLNIYRYLNLHFFFFHSVYPTFLYISVQFCSHSLIVSIQQNDLSSFIAFRLALFLGLIQVLYMQVSVPLYLVSLFSTTLYNMYIILKQLLILFFGIVTGILLWKVQKYKFLWKMLHLI